jgi:hypothetical protein
MNRKIIQKVIAELNKENPKLDYVRGILETLLESLPENIIASVPYITPTSTTVDLSKLYPQSKKELPQDERLDDAEIMEKETKAKMEKIKDSINKNVIIE